MRSEFFKRCSVFSLSELCISLLFSFLLCRMATHNVVTLSEAYITVANVCDVGVSLESTVFSQKNVYSYHTPLTWRLNALESIFTSSFVEEERVQSCSNACRPHSTPPEPNNDTTTGDGHRRKNSENFTVVGRVIQKDCLSRVRSKPAPSTRTVQKFCLPEWALLL